jgi:hypothetical protein
MAWIPPGSPVQVGVRSWLIVAQAFFGLSVKRAQRPVLRHVSRSMDLRSVCNRNRGHTLREPVLLHPHPPRPLLPPAGEPGSGRFCKKSGTDPARLTWGMLALFASSTIVSILKIEHVQGCVLFAQSPCYAPWTCSTGGGISAYLRQMAWIAPGSPVRRGVRGLVDRCQVLYAFA